MPQTKLRRAIAGVVAALCLFSTLYFAWWFLALSFAVGAWGGLEQFHDARRQAERLEIVLLAVSLIVQVMGGVAIGVALGVEDGTIRGCLRRTHFLTLRFFAVTTATPVLIVAVLRPRWVSFFGWAVIAAVVSGIVIAVWVRIGSARTTPTRIPRI